MRDLSIGGWTSILLGFGYIIYCAYGFDTNPNKKFYHKLFVRQTFLTHLVAALGLFCYGYYRCNNGHYQETFYFAPLIFLIALMFFNWLTRLATDRNILISTRWDSRPPQYKWYIDGFFSFLIVLIPILSSVLAMNKFRFGEFFR
ncbi:hypothetical protein IQ13_0491 [Lacibacter cauensis]|uniref:Uncharacterized protein n=1 Tax=Lacibacter cauensis TaxID=510947 RepID=A0A562SVQ6_9BACT|nr:hypothetical protein IQ13_0491 [Lacibacter cauensis]